MIFLVVTQWPIDLHAAARSIRINHRAGIGMDAQIFALVSDEANTVYHRVEVETELCAEQAQRERRAAHLRGAAGAGVDGVETQRGADAIELAVGGAEVNAGQTLVRLHAGERKAAQYGGGLTRVETDQFIARGAGQHDFAARGRRRGRQRQQGARACEQAEQQRAGTHANLAAYPSRARSRRPVRMVRMVRRPGRARN